MSLFVNTSNLQGYQPDCSNINISDTIERECLSVLHKLHDQVNGLQLVQVVVQPLAKLFNPASLAALATNISSSPASKHTNAPNNLTFQSHNSSNIASSHASSPSSQVPSSIGSHLANDPEGTTITCDTPISNHHSRSQSFASSFSGGGGPSHVNMGNNSILSSSSTYMMSPDTAQALIARLDTDRDVNWLMEIIGYGLSMPFSLTGEQDSVKDCCTIYCEWLAAALLPYNEHNEDSKYQQLNRLVPVPIKNEPNRYARKMLSHLYNVFLPRQPIGNSNPSKHSSTKEDSDAMLTAISRQAVLCHRVLRTIESIAHNRSNLMEDETWNHLLALLLTVNDKLLSPPTEPDDIGTQLHDRVLGVLFDLMLLASTRSIPDVNLWKTFNEMCLNWRHRPALVEHWKRITSLLTRRIIALPKLSIINEQPIVATSLANPNPLEASISKMDYENLSQTWYRFLHIIGSPVELSDPAQISRTDEFYHAACVANSVLDPRHHPCLNVLPTIFLNSMLGLKEFVDMLINNNHEPDSYNKRAPSQTQQNQDQQLGSQAKYDNPDRPRCNSILHIFGDWLFSAALIGSDLCLQVEPMEQSVDADSSNISEGLNSMGSTTTATELDPISQGYSPAFKRKHSHQSTSSHASSSTAGRRRNSKQLDASLLSNKKITLEPPLTAESFEAGQAEAMSVLCRIFSHKSTLEDVTPAYLARFYLCIQHCLNFGSGVDSPGMIKRQLLASVLMNSTKLLQNDLDGINLLIPAFIKAIELVFECHEKDTPIQPPPRQHSKNNNTSRNESSALRKACISTLVNLIAYPQHFKDLPIRNCLDGTSPTTTFESLRPRLMKLLFVALQTETDPTNMQILFGGLSLAIHDLKSYHSSTQERPKDAKSKGNIQNEASSSYSRQRTNSEADNISQSSFVFNSADGFMIKSLHVTCYLLINTWKHDNIVSLAALEVLTTVARVSAMSSSDMHSSGQPISTSNNNVIEMKAEYMQTTKWICDYICNQCSRPPPAHSRDMHSTIVAAYQSLSVWFYNHPYLLTDVNCVGVLMEVIELGVSGQKSKSMSINPTVGVATHTIISKGEKLLKPSSMRVRDAAEALLNVCLVRTCQDGAKNISICDTDLNEVDLAGLVGSMTIKPTFKQTHEHNELRQLEAYKSFRYFSDENSVIFSLLEGTNSDSLGRDYSICLLRTPFGKHCWAFNFNYCSERSREKIIANKTISLMKRPFHQQNSNTFNEALPFQKGQTRSLYFNRKAKFFPESIEDWPTNDLDRLVTSLDDYARGNVDQTTDPKFLAHLDKMNKIFNHQVLAEQKVLAELCNLRNRGTLQLDCEEPQVASNFDAARIIMTHFGLKNRLQPIATDDVSLQTFVESLRSLDELTVRTRDVVNVFYVRRNRTLPDEILEGARDRVGLNLDFFDWLLDLGRFTGQTGLSEDKSVSLLWSDMCQELKFTVPTKQTLSSNCFVTIYWLECSEDMAHITTNLLSSTASVNYYIQPMKSGLFRVDLNVPQAPPLVDGMTLNKSTLGSLVRESILNLCRRRRLDADSYQPAHVKRRLLIQDLCNSYRISTK